MANKRVIFGIYAVGLAPDGSTSYTAVHGLQSIGITTTFNLEQVFEIGQSNIYQNLENIPDIEITTNKVMDGYIPIYCLATRAGKTSNTLYGRSAAACSMAMSIFGDTSDSASGTPLREVNMSGLFISSVGYTLPVDGFCTEDVTFVGNHKVWKSSGFTFTGSLFTNQDAPLSFASGTGGVQRRQNVVFGGTGGNYTLLPTPNYGGIPGISASGTNDKVADVYNAHIQSIKVSVSLGRESLLELGRRNPYYRPINALSQVTTDIELLSQYGDDVSATDTGVITASGTNLEDKAIRIYLQEGLNVDLGTRNKLSNVAMGGGDTGGANQTLTFSYVNFNFFTVSHPME